MERKKRRHPREARLFWESTTAYDWAFRQVCQRRLPWWRSWFFSPAANYQWKHRQAELTKRRSPVLRLPIEKETGMAQNLRVSELVGKPPF
ncbi:hypothetical protein SAMN05421823_106121 [Catalinimonas alkaloidigena]|uniref:Uncharacterized protein n=1 Tax=Catalinimonas alkaloidigena TaxID=1075417 RepID=A0A1G9KCM3_9BACT|nr:hypothetical protein SAMN05421823_106121 [Catalinimonas alkaloidigena]